jgi:hypothetical protein
MKTDDGVLAAKGPKHEVKPVPRVRKEASASKKMKLLG